VKRIYPFVVKPASNIQTWEDWPSDVQELLHRWNRNSTIGLSFLRSALVFKCYDCEEFCQAHENGAAVLNDRYSSLLHQQWLCDDCLIARVRRFLPIWSHYGESRSVARSSCTCMSSGITHDQWATNMNCSYHRLAAQFPLDHSIPWACPTFWDGCNCTGDPKSDRQHL
jgi:hypothetical protein